MSREDKSYDLNPARTLNLNDVFRQEFFNNELYSRALQQAKERRRYTVVIRRRRRFRACRSSCYVNQSLAL